MGVLFFKPIPRLAIWGHTLVKDYFGYHDFPMELDRLGHLAAKKGLQIFVRLHHIKEKLY